MKAKLILTSFVLLTVSCGQIQKKNAPVSAAEEKVPVVEVATAVIQDVPRESDYSTTVQPYAINNIAPQTAGRIQKLNVEIGDFVKAGDVLAEMDCVQLNQAELKLRNAEDELMRARALYESGGLSKSDFESIELSYKVSSSAFDNLKENTVLESPITGVITARNYDRGDMYAMASPIYVVQQIVPVKILVAISETDYTRVKLGGRVFVSSDALPDLRFSGRISRIYPVMDASTHTFTIEVLVPNENKKLRPGMYAKAMVDFGSVANVVVPDSAVQKQQGSGVRVVYVADADNVISVNEVTVGRHFDGKYEILTGLKEGDVVVTKGLNALRAGIKVSIKQ